MHSRASLAADFRALGVASGDTVMLHASVRSVGRVIGGPDAIHLALGDALEPGGTLFMYAGCPRFYDEVGRGNLTPEEEAEVLAHLPAFDPLTARAARDHGVLAEFFRTTEGTRTSHHVARFIARGNAAEALTVKQPWDFAFGAGSPLERFMARDGKILLLGCDHDHVTFLHYVEHVADFPGKIVARFQVPVLVDGGRVWREMKEVDTSVRAHANWPGRFFSSLVDAFIARERIAAGRVGDATSFLLPARGLYEFARPEMERIARGV
jgi:aminoglycoside 3-N-acetyltransferase